MKLTEKAMLINKDLCRTCCILERRPQILTDSRQIEIAIASVQQRVGAANRREIK